jgi:hypothetical protein
MNALLLLLLVLAPAALAADAVVVVSTRDSLLGALRDQTIRSLVVSQGIHLKTSMASVLPINR